jgi:hypothetical protein
MPKRIKKHKPSVGKGHGGLHELPKIKAIPLPDLMRLWQFKGMIQADLKAFRMGQCSILVGHDDYYHMSISNPLRYPTWDEVAKARYELIPDDITMMMPLPPKAEYINIERYCFQLVQDGWFTVHEEKVQTRK